VVNSWHFAEFSGVFDAFTAMQLHFLGTAGYHPCDTRHTACLMLPEIGIVLDAGTAFYRVRELLTTDTLDIFLTHVHLDHSVGMTFLFDVIEDRPMQHVCVHAEEDKLSAVRNHLLAEPLFPVIPPCEFIPLGSDPFDLPRGGTLTHFPLDHPGGSVGYRLDWPDRSLAYVTDTIAAQSAPYIQKIRGVDVLVHECYFTDNQTEQAHLTGHSCLTQVCQVAKEASAGMLLLTHINPLADASHPLDLDLAKRIFPNVLVAADGMRVEF
jgi:ribonuclease BN (tRNA processing enzyme)